MAKELYILVKLYKLIIERKNGVSWKTEESFNSLFLR